MEEEKFHVVEWKIDNFSCWNKEIHSEVIKSPKSLYSCGITFNLFPSVHNGHLVVRIQYDGPRIFSGDLSFIGSDGSILCTQQVDSRDIKVRGLELPPGPKFEEVVGQIRKNEDLYQDRLTLRYREKNILVNDSVENMSTTIKAFENSLKISPSILSGSIECEISSVFYPLNRGRTFSVLAIYSRVSKDQMDNPKIELALKPLNFKSNIWVRTRISVLNNAENVVRSEENEKVFRENSKWAFSTSLTRNEIASKEFSVTLTVKIIEGTSYVHSVGTCLYYKQPFASIASNKFRPPGTSVPEEDFSKRLSNVISNKPCNSAAVLAKQLMCLYQDQDFSDFQLKCGTVSFPVHRAILSARSPVLETMFSTDMQEAASGCMDIVDMDVPTLCLFLTYLYTGTVEDLQGDSALKLYYAADKYQVPSLKRECADYLGANVSISNVCDILSLAEQHQDDELTSSAHDFILENYNEVLRSQEWKSLMKSEPVLALETVTHFADKNLVKRI